MGGLLSKDIDWLVEFAGNGAEALVSASFIKPSQLRAVPSSFERGFSILASLSGSGTTSSCHVSLTRPASRSSFGGNV